MRRIFPPSMPPDGGTAVFSPPRWRNATPWELVPFSHRSASRTFISQPGRTPPPAVTLDGDLRLDGGGEQAGLRYWSHPQPQGCSSSSLGWGRAEPALCLPRGSVGHPLPRYSRKRALIGPAGGPDFDNAGLVDGRRRHLQRVGFVGFAPGGPFCRRAAAAPCTREDLSGDLPGGRWPLPWVPRRRRLEKSPSPTGSPPPSALRASGSSYLSSPLERRCGRGQDCSSAHPEACAAAARPSGAGVVVVVVRAGGSEPLVSLLLLHRPSPMEWGCSYLRRGNRSSVCNGTLNARVFVHYGFRGLNMYVTSARSRVFSSFLSAKTRLLII
jgi:hypothetical protein